MIKKLLIIGTLALGCQNQVFTEKPPLDKFQLVPIIADLRILESSYAIRYQQVDSNVVQLQSYQQDIFNHYQVTKETVQKAVRYFAARPDSMKALDSLVLIKLEEKMKAMPAIDPLSKQEK